MRVERTIAAVFAAVGFGMLGGAGLAWHGTQQFRARAAVASGVVIDLVDSDDTTHAVFEFKDSAGQTHRVRSSIGTNPPAYEIGERVQIYYDPARPEHARADGWFETWSLTLLLGGMGSIFGSIGGGMAGFSALRSRRTRWLQQSGVRIQARLMAVEYDGSISVNGRSPWVITAQWLNPQSGRVHVFQSERMWFDPSPYLEGELLDVLIDPERPHRHWIDTSFLPKQA